MLTNDQIEPGHHSIAYGWYEVGQTGRHKHFKHPTKPGKVTVPHPKRDLPVKTVKSIETQSGVDLS